MAGRKYHHRIFATLLALGILALLVSTFSLVINLATRTSSPSSSAVLPPHKSTLDLTTFLAQYIRTGGKFTPQMKSQITRPYITFTADTLSPSEDKLTGTLEVIIPPGLPPFMYMNGKPVFNCGGASCVPYPQYAGIRSAAAR